MTLSPTSIAYLAGLFDGEGTVTISRNKLKPYRLTIKVAVYNTDSEILSEYLHFGGSVYHLMDKRPRNKPFLGMWQCNKANIPAFCRTILKYNREAEKRRKLSLILDYEDYLFSPDRGSLSKRVVSDEHKIKRIEFGDKFDQIVIDARQTNKTRMIEKW